MPLISCPDCGKEISDAARTCVQCGRPMNSTEAVSVPDHRKTLNGRKVVLTLVRALAIAGVLVSWVTIMPMFVPWVATTGLYAILGLTGLVGVLLIKDMVQLNTSRQ